MKKIEEIELKFKDYSQLSILDSGHNVVRLFIDKKHIGFAEVWTDVENEKREYIIVNHEIIYLDTINKI